MFRKGRGTRTLPLFFLPVFHECLHGLVGSQTQVLVEFGKGVVAVLTALPEETFVIPEEGSQFHLGLMLEDGVALHAQFLGTDGHGHLDVLYLFAINCVFIATATYVMTKAFGFHQAEYQDVKVRKRTKFIMMGTTLIFIIPSILSAIVLIRNNDFDTRAAAFVQNNKSLESAIIYDYTVTHEKGRYLLEVYLSGDKLDDEQKAALLESANGFGIREDQISIKENKSSKNLLVADIVNDIYANTERQLAEKEKEVESLKAELREYQNDSIPYIQIAKEAKSFYPSVNTIGISRGSSVSTDSLDVRKTTFVNATTSSKMKEEEETKLLEWLKIRLNTDDVALTITTEKTEATRKPARKAENTEHKSI